MTEGIERELRGLDGERPLPPELYRRLEAALLDDAAPLFDALDTPRPIPPATRAALERELTGGPRRRDRRSVLLAAAAAVLVVVGSVAALRSGSSSSNRHVAAGTVRSVPAAGVPPVLRAEPTTTESSAAAAAAAPAAPETTRRSTTTTTWNCGLCARNGYSGSYAAPASPTTVATWQPTGGAAQVQAAALAGNVLNVDPSSGPHRGGTVVTLTGSGFTGASGVLFGSLSAVNFTVVSDTEIRVMTPASPRAEKVTVSVTFADGSKTPTSDSGPFFTYT